MNKKNIRIFHGPVNICGIGGYLANWQRENKGAKSDFIVYTERNHNNKISHRDLRLDEKPFIIAFFEKVKLLIFAIKNYDIFHFYFAKSFLQFNLDLPILKLFGKKIIMNYAGSDIRLTSLEIKRNPYYSIIQQYERKKTIPDFVKYARMKWQNIWCDRFIAIRNLYAHASMAIPNKKIIRDLWITNTFDFSILKNINSFPNKKHPVIFHAPTDRFRKGTNLIINTLEEMKNEGIDFDFYLFEDKPHDEVLDFINRKADIVVDQMISGDFGVISVEALSMGKTVCAYIIDEVYKTHSDLPIVNINPDNIKEKLIWLIENPDVRLEIGKKSQRFAKDHFDRDKIYERLWEIYLELLDE